MNYTPELPTNNDDVIDSRDVIFWIAELEKTEPIDRDEDDQDTLDALYALQEAAEQSPDWPYGETLIKASYFEEYAEELAYDIGAIDRDASWPLRHIDWQAAADELSQDYFSVDFDGVEYWIRS